MERWLRYIFLYVVLVVLQLFVFDQLHFRGFVNAFPYIFFILALPFSISGRSILLLSALLGLTIDFFSGTMGVHMAALVSMGYGRILLLPALAPKGDYEADLSPSVRANGWGWYIRYSFILTFIHSTILYLVESFSFVNLGYTFLNILFSTLFTSVLLVIFQLSGQKRNSSL